MPSRLAGALTAVWLLVELAASAIATVGLLNDANDICAYKLVFPNLLAVDNHLSINDHWLSLVWRAGSPNAGREPVRKHMRLSQVYLYFNGVVYLSLAIRSTVASRSSAVRLGYLSLSDSGRSEYLVAYGGLQLGLAVLFGMLGSSSSSQRLGLVIASGFYVPIVAYRIITGLAYSSFSQSTLVALGVEMLLLSVAVVLLFYNPLL